MQLEQNNCQQTIEELVRRHSWRLVSVDTLLECIECKKLKMPLQPVHCGQLGLACYSRYLYEACCSSNDGQREQAYSELNNYVRGVSNRNWCDLEDDVVSLATSIIIETLKKCRNPEAFLAFINFKIQDASGRIIRSIEREEKICEKLQARLAHYHRAYSGSIETQVEKSEGFQRLYDAVQRLSNERQRIVILLRYIDGLSDSEIADLLQVTPGNIRVLRSRGMDSLRQDVALRSYFIES